MTIESSIQPLLAFRVGLQDTYRHSQGAPGFRFHAKSPLLHLHPQ
jgi:hypothetical protein